VHLAVSERIDSTFMLSLNDAGQLLSNVSIIFFVVTGIHSTLYWYVLQRHSSECGTWGSNWCFSNQKHS
jgi:hypothetical protein